MYISSQVILPESLYKPVGDWLKNVTTGYYRNEHERPLDLNLIEIHNNAIPLTFSCFGRIPKRAIPEKIVELDLVFPLTGERGGFIKLGVALNLQLLLKMGFSRPNIFILTQDVQIKFRSSFKALHFRMFSLKAVPLI